MWWGSIQGVFAVRTLRLLSLFTLSQGDRNCSRSECGG
jgi:hypothetical protein